jgi:hypothetical protein
MERSYFLGALGAVEKVFTQLLQLGRCLKGISDQKVAELLRGKVDVGIHTVFLMSSE